MSCTSEMKPNPHLRLFIRLHIKEGVNTETEFNSHHCALHFVDCKCNYE